MNMRRLALKGKRGSGLFALLDHVDWHFARSKSWYLAKNGYPTTRIRRRLICLHRFVMGDREGFEVDHINRDKLDNRGVNLRWVTRGENVRNVLRADNRLGVRGVWFDPITKKFCAMKREGGRAIWRGRHETLEKATRALKN